MREEKNADLKAGVRADKSLKDRAGKEKAGIPWVAGEQGRDSALACCISSQLLRSLVLGRYHAVTLLVLGFTSPKHSPAVVSAHTPHSDAHDGLGV